MIAAEIMTENPRTVLETDSLGEAVDVLQSMEIRHLPVLDEAGNLVGMLSDRDLRPLMHVSTESVVAEQAEQAEDVVSLETRPVCDWMSSDVVTVEPDTDVREIIDKLLDAHVGAVPVVDGEGSVVGIVSYVDVLRALAAAGAAVAEGP